MFSRPSSFVAMSWSRKPFRTAVYPIRRAIRGFLYFPLRYPKASIFHQFLELIKALTIMRYVPFLEHQCQAVVIVWGKHQPLVLRSRCEDRGNEHNRRL